MVGWDKLRHLGPSDARFDAHVASPSVQSLGVSYTSFDVPTCLAEAYQSRRVVKTVFEAPYLTSAKGCQGSPEHLFVTLERRRRAQGCRQPLDQLDGAPGLGEHGGGLDGLGLWGSLVVTQGGGAASQVVVPSRSGPGVAQFRSWCRTVPVSSDVWSRVRWWARSPSGDRAHIASAQKGPASLLGGE